MTNSLHSWAGAGLYVERGFRKQSSLAEQKNAILRKLESQLAYMNQTTFMWYIRIEQNGAMVGRVLRNHEVHGSIPGLNSRAQLSSISLVRCTGSHWGSSMKWGRLELQVLRYIYSLPASCPYIITNLCRHPTTSVIHQTCLW